MERDVKLFGRKRMASDKPVGVVQQYLTNGAQNYEAFERSLSLLASDETLWRERKWPDGRPLEGFGDLIVALPPHGCGIRNTAPLVLVRRVLVSGGYYGPWTDVVEKTMRKPGCPPKTLANSDSSERFYRVPTSSTALDRILLNLKRRNPEMFARVCAGECSPRQGAIKAGLIGGAGPKRQYGACDLDAAAALAVGPQGRLLCDLFRCVRLDAQCTLISRLIEPRLDPDLARRWRETAAATSGT